MQYFSNPLPGAEVPTRIHVKNKHPPSPIPGLLNQNSTVGPENIQFKSPSTGGSDGHAGLRTTALQVTIAFTSN